jgi:hypothetical protein
MSNIRCNSRLETFWNLACGFLDNCTLIRTVVWGPRTIIIYASPIFLPARASMKTLSRDDVMDVVKASLNLKHLYVGTWLKIDVMDVVKASLNLKHIYVGTWLKIEAL